MENHEQREQQNLIGLRASTLKTFSLRSEGDQRQKKPPTDEHQNLIMNAS